MPTGMRRVVAVVCATALASSPVLLAPTTAGAAGAATTSARAATPHLSALLTKKTIVVKGADDLKAGRAHLEVRGRGIVEFATFKAGYDVADFTADVNKFGAKNDIKALKRALKNTTIIGGLAGGGSGTIVFPKPGAYTPFSLGDRGVVTGKTLVVAGPKRSSKTPRTDGSIIGKNGPAWGGASQLPAKGRFEFKNKADQPHFVAMQQVQPGTTTDQVLAFLQSEEEGPPPSWLLPASMETGTLSPGRSMTVDYDLPAGQYVVMCFFPDPKMGGMPHALMGMLRMVTLS
ncbi:hypothetical protein [Nocardioides pini]|uniref:hypothetical protein n=1 Tax=Nocardioides pini TaxID=2975053 RepID=UPI00227AE80D|nr:hypothetical protein [Nocardioides pini]